MRDHVFAAAIPTAILLTLKGFHLMKAMLLGVIDSGHLSIKTLYVGVAVDGGIVLDVMVGVTWMLPQWAC